MKRAPSPPSTSRGDKKPKRSSAAAAEATTGNNILGFSCVIVCDHVKGKVPTEGEMGISLPITIAEVNEMICKSANFRFIPKYCEDGVKPKDYPTGSVLNALAQAVSACDRKLLEWKSEYEGIGEGSGGLSLSGFCSQMGNAGISNFAGDTTKSACNRYLVTTYQSLEKDQPSLFGPDIKWTEDDAKQIFDLHAKAQENVRDDYENRNSTEEVGSGWNSTLFPKEGVFTEKDITAALAAISESNNKDPSLLPSAKAKLNWIQKYDDVKLLDSFRGSIDLRERGRLLTRQFGSLPITLQRKLLQDSCFTKSHIARIQMYANWVPDERVTLDMHQDGVPMNVVARVVHSCTVVD